MSQNERYLGDGVYARWDGYQMWLILQTGEEIAVNDEVLAEAIRFDKDMRDA